MDKLGRKLRLKLANKTVNQTKTISKRKPGESLPGGVRDVRSLIQEGLDPVHAVYSYMQQVSSHFVECFSDLPELRLFVKAVIAAEENYIPVGPPVSPLTASYFWTWVLYDMRTSKRSDTIGECQIELNDLIGFNENDLQVLKNLTNSRMGIYEHVGFEGPHVRLRELITDVQFVCHVTSGYRGSIGELWYVRLLPPLCPEIATYHIAFTTPYILTLSSKDDWKHFLKRKILEMKSNDEHFALHEFFKYGITRNYWNEFVFKAYHHHTDNAIFLAGIPDLISTLPHN
jgi:hypothetical protein